MMKSIAIWIALLSSALSYSQTEIIQLKDNWTFKNSDSSQWYPATVPGTIHTDLYDNELITHPYNKDNEIKLRWIEEAYWTYKTSVEISAEQLESEHLELVCEGLDTYSTLYVNGEEVASTTNMFREYDFDLKNFLKKGTNEIEFRFEPPVKVNGKWAMRNDYLLPSGNETEEPMVSAYTRKAAYHFGWDFAPRFVTCGIWRPIYIRCWNKFRIKDVQVVQKKVTEKRALMDLVIEFEGDPAGNGALNFKCGQSVAMKYLPPNSKTLNYELQIDDPELWEPNGYGYPNVYRYVLEIFDKDGHIDSKNVNFGIRDIELVNEPDEFGTSFHFLVNGRKVFCKGANYVPMDMFLPNVNKSVYREMLLMVKDMNMNMIRVWGGGVYENDDFYNLCDSMGIMVWQDFMFANSMYPIDLNFQHDVQAEVQDNVRRLRNHPCIAVWCGNNEVEVAWKNWGWQKQYRISEKDSAALWDNYKMLFHELIPSELKLLDPKRAYTPTSPLSNWGNTRGLIHSSMHYWGVWHGKEDIESYKENVGRFMVEYGFPAYPWKGSMRPYVDLNDDVPDMEEFERRQKSYIGNDEIRRHIKKYFGDHGKLPLNEWIGMNQAVQSYALRTAIQAHRTSPKCMGSLLWQLNDCWPGPSWSIIDYNFERKPAYYEVKTQFSPVLAIVEFEDSIITATAKSDVAGENKYELHLHMIDEENNTFHTEIAEFSLQYLESKEVMKLDLRRFDPRNYSLEAQFLQYTIKDVATGEVIYSDSFFFCWPKDRSIPVNKI